MTTAKNRMHIYLDDEHQNQLDAMVEEARREIAGDPGLVNMTVSRSSVVRWLLDQYRERRQRQGEAPSGP